jgi:SnoaL-like protein
MAASDTALTMDVNRGAVMNAANMNDQVEQLLDRAQISDLVFRLGVCLDEGRFGEMASLFIEDATASTPGGKAQGRKTILALAERNHRPEYATQHVSGNLLVDLEGDRATVRGNLVVQVAPPPAPDTPAQVPPALAPTLGFTLGEVYHIDCVRTPDGWRFARVDTVPVWMSGKRPTRRPLEPAGDSNRAAKPADTARH